MCVYCRGEAMCIANVLIMSVMYNDVEDDKKKRNSKCNVMFVTSSSLYQYSELHKSENKNKRNT